LTVTLLRCARSTSSSASATGRGKVSVPAHIRPVAATVTSPGNPPFLQHLLGFLRADQVDALTPQPDLSGLPDLIAQPNSGPLTVNLQVDGERRQLPGVLELSAYRPIQVALTNAVKHSGGSAAHVRVTYGAHALDIEVCNNGKRRARYIGPCFRRRGRARSDRDARTGPAARWPPAGGPAARGRLRRDAHLPLDKGPQPSIVVASGSRCARSSTRRACQAARGCGPLVAGARGRRGVSMRDHC
jgi:hypothetical protein